MVDRIFVLEASSGEDSDYPHLMVELSAEKIQALRDVVVVARGIAGCTEIRLSAAVVLASYTLPDQLVARFPRLTGFRRWAESDVSRRLYALPKLPISLSELGMQLSDCARLAFAECVVCPSGHVSWEAREKHVDVAHSTDIVDVFKRVGGFPAVKKI